MPTSAISVRFIYFQPKVDAYSAWAGEIRTRLALMLPQISPMPVEIHDAPAEEHVPDANVHFRLLLLANDEDILRCEQLINAEVVASDLFHNIIIHKNTGTARARSWMMKVPVYHIAAFDTPAAWNNGNTDNFGMQLSALAYDMVELAKSKTAAVQPATRQSVFVGDVSVPFSTERFALKRELSSIGWHVQPPGRLPAHEAGNDEALAALISSTQLSVHFLHPALQPVEGVLIEDRQIRQALARKQQHHDFNILLWILPLFEGVEQRTSPEYLQLVERYSSDNNIETLRLHSAQMRQYLRTAWDVQKQDLAQHDAPHDSAAPASGASVYFMYSRQDEDAAAPFLHHLRSAGLQVLVPSFSGDIMADRGAHQESLTHADSLVVFGDGVNAQWLTMKIFDVLKAPGLGRSKPIVARYIVASTTSAAATPYAQHGFTLLPLADNDAAQALAKELSLAQVQR
jgi:hypothetical protein